MNDSDTTTGFSSQYFVLVVPGAGLGLVLAVVDKNNFTAWMDNRTKLRLRRAQGIRVVPSNTQASDTNTTNMDVSIGQWLLIDTPQEEIYISDGTVEIIGQIVINNGKENCFEHPRLFSLYSNSYNSYKATRAGIVSPTLDDIATVSKTNVHPLHTRKP